MASKSQKPDIDQLRQRFRILSLLRALVDQCHDSTFANRRAFEEILRYNLEPKDRLAPKVLDAALTLLARDTQILACTSSGSTSLIVMKELHHSEAREIAPNSQTDRKDGVLPFPATFNPDNGTDKQSDFRNPFIIIQPGKDHWDTVNQGKKVSLAEVE
jgi:hypothetical protein